MTEKIAKLPKPEQPSTEKPGTGETKPSGDNKTPVTSDNNAGTAKQTLKPGTKIVDKKTKAAYKVMADNTVQYTKVTSKQ